jgi:hypothetical protein
VFDETNISDYFSTFFSRFHVEKGIPESAITTTVTGICLLYNQTIVHLIEASPELIMAHLRDITSAPPEKRIMENVKIISSVEDVI